MSAVSPIQHLNFDVFKKQGRVAFFISVVVILWAITEGSISHDG